MPPKKLQTSARTKAVRDEILRRLITVSAELQVVHMRALELGDRELADSVRDIAHQNGFAVALNARSPEQRAAREERIS
jgi:hypothetical protein